MITDTYNVIGKDEKDLLVNVVAIRDAQIEEIKSDWAHLAPLPPLPAEGSTPEERQLLAR